MGNPLIEAFLPTVEETQASASSEVNFRLGTITSVSGMSATVKLDGDTNPMPAGLRSLGALYGVGARVLVLLHNRRATIIGTLADGQLQLNQTNFTINTADGSFTNGLQVVGGAVRLKSPSRSANAEVILLITSVGDPGIWFSRDGSTSGTQSRIYSSSSGLALVGGTDRQVIVTNPILYSGIPSTTSGSANIVAASAPANVLYKTTSSRRNKIDIENVSTPPERLLELEAREWWDRNEYEGVEGDTSTLKRIPGLIAEELLEAGLDQFVTYEQDPDNPEEMRVSGVMYDRLWTLLIPLVKAQRDLIAEQQTRIKALEDAVTALQPETE